MGYEVKDVNPKDKMWLVRASTRLLGPYSLEEIVELLTYNQLSFVDEIRRPKSRWNYVRDYPYLTETVKQNRDKLNLNSTKTNPLSVITATFTKTESTMEAKAPEAPISVDFDEIKDIEPLKEVPFSFSPKAKNGVPPPSNPSVVAKSYGLLNDFKVKEQIKAKNEKFTKGAIALAIALAVSFGFYKGAQKYIESNRLKEVLDSIVLDYKLKLYSKAFKAYKQVQSGQEIPQDILDTLIPLRITMGKEVYQIKPQLQMSLENSHLKRKAEVYNLLGLANMIEGDSKSAYEHYRNALIQDPSNEFAALNMGTQSVKNYGTAVMTDELRKSIISQYTELSPSKGFNFTYPQFYFFVKSMFIYSFKELFMSDSRYMEEELLRSAESSAMMRSELYVMYFALAKNSKSEVDLERYIDFIGQIPRQHNEFAKDPSLDWSRTSWDMMEAICSRVFKDLHSTFPKLVSSYCALELGDYTKAEQILNSVGLQAIGNSNHFELMQLHLAFAKESMQTVENLLRKSDLNIFPAAQYYRAQLCLSNGNKECAIESFKKLSESRWKHIAAAGLFKIDRNKYSPLVFESLKDEPFYMPLIEARSLIESKQ